MSDNTIRDIKITPALKSNDPQSFIAWRASAKLQLGIHGLLKYVEQPRDSVLATFKTEAEKKKGEIDDMRAALAIQSSLGGDQACLTHEYETAYGKWKALNDQFMRESNVRAVVLRSKLNRLQPKPDGSNIESYLHELQMIYAEPAANGRAVQEQDKVQKLLDDLPMTLLYVRPPAVPSKRKSAANQLDTNFDLKRARVADRPLDVKAAVVSTFLMSSDLFSRTIEAIKKLAAYEVNPTFMHPLVKFSNLNEKDRVDLLMLLIPELSTIYGCYKSPMVQTRRAVIAVGNESVVAFLRARLPLPLALDPLKNPVNSPFSREDLKDIHIRLFLRMLRVMVDQLIHHPRNFEPYPDIAALVSQVGPVAPTDLAASTPTVPTARFSILQLRKCGYITGWLIFALREHCRRYSSTQHAPSILAYLAHLQVPESELAVRRASNVPVVQSIAQCEIDRLIYASDAAISYILWLDAAVILALRERGPDKRAAPATWAHRRVHEVIVSPRHQEVWAAFAAATDAGRVLGKHLDTFSRLYRRRFLTLHLAELTVHLTAKYTAANKTQITGRVNWRTMMSMMSSVKGACVPVGDDDDDDDDDDD
ncbi:hypothetical protein GGF32_001195 [Allomyces javanicus]|nr:hypothetical protein GGF32_001195 [Allomyces javanicus]